jgi:hypothetical protein
MPSNRSASEIQTGAGQLPSGSLPTDGVLQVAHRAAVAPSYSLQDVYNGSFKTGDSPRRYGYNLRAYFDGGAYKINKANSSYQVDKWHSIFVFESGPDADWNTLVGFPNTGWMPHLPAIGVAREVPFRGADSVFQKNLTLKKGPGWIEANPLEFSQATLTDKGGTLALTYLNDTTNGLLNPGGAGSDVIQCPAGQYFALGAPVNGQTTAIRPGLDLIQAQLADGTIQTYIITRIVTTTTVQVVTLGYGAPALVADTSAKLRIFQPSVLIGGSDITDDSHFMGQVLGEWARPFVYGLGSVMTSDFTTEVPIKPGLFLSRVTYQSAWEAGYFQNGALTVGFSLNGDGGFTATSGRQQVNMLGCNRDLIHWNAPLQNGADLSTAIDLNTASYWAYKWTGTTSLGSDSPSLTITGITNSPFIGTLAGDEFTVVICRNQTVMMPGSGSFSVTWPSGIKFSGTDGTLPPDENFKALYRFVYDGSEWLATRTMYPVP